MSDKIRLGISTCLLGENVRYDGGHRHDRYLTDTLGHWVEYVPVCPEVECGLGIPREPMHLEGDSESPRLVTIHTRVDLTERMQAWADTRVRELESEALCGFVFKSDSPSSGMERVKVYGAKGGVTRNGVGIFARTFMNHFPLLPVEDEGRLHDAEIRENFIESIFTLKRWRDLVTSGRTRGNLVTFHTQHKLLIMAHSPGHYQEMGRLVAKAKGVPVADLFGKYQELLLTALRLRTTPRKHVNVLQHITGYFRDRLSGDEKRELLEIIGEYRAGVLPLIVPVTLLNHYVRKYDQPYLRDQLYLHPHPLELQLRNHS